ncbi:unnamed protein product [Aureobasidium uvarum]|uniref:Uncharacterized protein n=1 Tax=Aureobasidium uvarum TaxID=2773716 RepID=A0A9N8PRA7_9PEZI|nr:unnamed protein product [Aureobasidium uvarum]
MDIGTAALESGYARPRHSDEDHDLHETQPLQPSDTYQRSDTSNSTKVRLEDSTVRSSMVDKRHTPYRETGRLTWSFELVAAVFSVACFIGLIILLAVSRGKEQRYWFGGHITLNGLVALITTITRASVMVSVAASLSQLKWNRFASNTSLHPLDDLSRYDSASRGPWGSLNLLIRPHL